jgi:hypothetical protein
MFPEGGGDENGKRPYVAEGTWHLVGTEQCEAGGSLHNFGALRTLATNLDSGTSV